MDKNEAKELLSFHSTRNEDIDNMKWEKGFLGSLRPFRGELYLPPYILQSETDWRDSYRKIDRGRKTVGCHVLCQSSWCHQSSGRLP